MIPVIYLPHYTATGAYEHLDPIKESLQVKDPDDAGVDMRAAIETDSITLEPGDSYVIPSGVKMHIGKHPLHVRHSGIGVYGALLPRSGLGFKHFVRLANTMGVIDAGFQNEIMIKVRNEGDHDLVINRGDRICQMVFHTYIKKIEFVSVSSFEDETTRGDKGFGASGVE